MQVLWLLPIVHLGICYAQQPDPQLQGAADAPPAVVPPQTIPEEPATITLDVAELVAIPTPANSPASEELCRSHVKAVHMVRLQSMIMLFEMKQTLINNLRSEIGDGFIYPFTSSLEKTQKTAIQDQRKDVDAKSKTYANAGLTEPNGTSYYASTEALYTALNAANTTLDNMHINNVLYIKQAWGEKDAYAAMKTLMQFDIQLYAKKVELVYKTVSDSVKLQTDPAEGNDARSNILNAHKTIRSAATYVSSVGNDAQQLPLSFVKYLDAKKVHDSAFNYAKGIVTSVNTACTRHMPTERRDTNVVIGDITAAKDAKEYMPLVPKRAVGDATTVQSWLKTAAFFRYIYALAVIRMSKTCHTLVAFLVTKAPSSDTEGFTNMYNAIQRDALAYITAMSAYVADVANAQMGTNHDNAAATMVMSAEEFIKQYMETVKTLVSALGDNDKVAGENEVLRADTEILRTAVAFLARMVRLYKMDMVDDPMVMQPAPYTSTISMLDRTMAMADGTKEFVAARMAAPDAMKSTIRSINVLKEMVKDAFDTTMSHNEVYRTFYPQGIDDADRHMKIFKDLESITNAQVFVALKPEEIEDSGKESSGFVLPGALLAAASALMML